jgi:uncharacterized delta-60 repeat protein
MFTARRNTVVRAAAHTTARALIESLETRRLLSAGDLDITFGDGGHVLNLPKVDARGDINDTAVQADNRIVASFVPVDQKAFGVRRYFNNGTLDTSFGDSGTALITLPGGGEFQSSLNMAVAVQSDGKILVGGRSSDQFALVRLTSSGKLDTTFNGDGIAMTDFGNGPSGGIRDLVVQPDGKIVAVGSSNGVIAMARYTTSGNLDTTFDGDGKVLTNLSGNGERKNAVALQSDGKIITAGAGSPDGLKLTVSRYTTTGALDTTFDGDGTRVTSFGGELLNVLIQPDGKILANSAGSVLRLNSNGSSDNSFGSNGAFSVPSFSGGADSLVGLGLRSDGKIVLGGTQKYFEVNFPQGVLLRLNSNGTLDGSFGTGGTKLFQIYQPTFVDSFQMLSDGRYFVGGQTNTQWPYLARFNSDASGNFETTFGIGGKAVVDLTGRSGRFSAAKVQSDGKVVALGSTINIATASTDIYLTRFNTDGTVDTAFGANGAVLIDQLGGTDFGYDLARAPGGKIVIIANIATDPSSAADPNDRAYLIARFNSDGTPDSSFGTNGRVIRDDLRFDLEASGSIAVQSDGKILIGESFATIRRLNLNGTLDTTFGTDGATVVPINGRNDTPILNLRVLPDNSILFLDGFFAAGIGRLTPNGTLDTSFGNGGLYQQSGNNFDAFEVLSDGSIAAVADLGANRDLHALYHVTSTGQLISSASVPNGRSMAVDSNDKIIVIDTLSVSSQQNASNTNDIVLRRYDKFLNLDTTFGNGGTVQTDVAYADFPAGGAIGPNGRLVVFGSATTASGVTSSPLLVAYQDDDANVPPPPETGSLSGFAFNDTNQNGQYDTGETKTGGKRIFLDGNGNGTLDAFEPSIVTDTNGNYTFDDLSAGTYHIRRVFPAGYTYSTAPLDVTLGAGQHLTDLAIGSKPGSTPPPQTGTLVGFTFDDKDIDGIFDTGEIKTTGKTVFLDSNGNNTLDAGEQSTVTDVNGNYKFSNLSAGTYHVRRVFPDGWTYSTAAIDVTLVAGQTISNLAIGSRPGTTTPPPTPTSISGFTFDDTDVDGAYDSNEKKTSGKTVFLDANNNGKLDSGERSVVTDTSGSFTFNNLSAGTYHVRRVFPSGWTYSTAPIDIDLANGESVAAVAIGSKPVSQQTGIIRGFTFNDTNDNGQYDAGETKTSGKKVFIDLNNNGFADLDDLQTYTAADGSFSFTGLDAGTYRVRREFPRGYTYSTPLLNIDLQAGEIFTDALIGSVPVA